MQTLRRFWRCESGATSVEYAMIAAGIAVVLTGVVQKLGKEVTTTFKALRKAFK